MRVIVELDEALKTQSLGARPQAAPKGTLDSALLEQFTAMQRQLMGLLSKQQSRDSAFLDSLKQQQDSLLASMQELVGKVGNGDGKDAILSAINSMKSTKTSFPDELMERFASMEDAIVTGMKKSRNRTFGSNY